MCHINHQFKHKINQSHTVQFLIPSNRLSLFLLPDVKVLGIRMVNSHIRHICHWVPDLIWVCTCIPSIVACTLLDAHWFVLMFDIWFNFCLILSSLWVLKELSSKRRTSIISASSKWSKELYLWAVAWLAPSSNITQYHLSSINIRFSWHPIDISHNST